MNTTLRISSTIILILSLLSCTSEEVEPTQKTLNLPITANEILDDIGINYWLIDFDFTSEDKRPNLQFDITTYDNWREARELDSNLSFAIQLPREDGNHQRTLKGQAFITIDARDQHAEFFDYTLRFFIEGGDEDLGLMSSKLENPIFNDPRHTEEKASMSWSTSIITLNNQSQATELLRFNLTQEEKRPRKQEFGFMFKMKFSADES
jgi:hypothetical protein